MPGQPGLKRLCVNVGVARLRRYLVDKSRIRGGTVVCANPHQSHEFERLSDSPHLSPKPVLNSQRETSVYIRAGFTLSRSLNPLAHRLCGALIAKVVLSDSALQQVSGQKPMRTKWKLKGSTRSPGPNRCSPSHSPP